MCDVSVWRALRKPAFPSSPLFAPLSSFPLRHIWFMCCWLPPSPGLDPELPPSPLIWFREVRLFQRKSPNCIPPQINPPPHMCAHCTGMRCLFFVYAISDLKCRYCMLTHTHIYLHAHTSPHAFLPWGLFDWQCPLLQGIMVETRGGGGTEEGWRVLRPGRGRVRKRVED